MVEDMKRVKFLFVFFIWLLFVTTQCNRDDCHRTITFVNNSSMELYIRLAGTSHHYSNLDSSQFYKMFQNPYNNPYQCKVESREVNKSHLFTRDCLESWIPEGRVIVYVFDAEVLKSFPWDTIGKYYMVLKTYRPTIEEMESSNWTITYTED